MTPERLEEIRQWVFVNWRIARHERAAFGELLEFVEQLQADVQRMSQYETAYRHALDAVDEVFQDYSGKSPPILPDFLGLGENKFLGVKKLAKEYLELQAENATLLRWCVKSTAGLSAPAEYLCFSQDDQANARELRRILEGTE